MKINWKQDYQGEFACPKCQILGMINWGVYQCNNKRRFHCLKCNHTCQESCMIEIKAVTDPGNHRTIWYKNYQVNDFVCPKCHAKNISFIRIDKSNKKVFKCESCDKYQYDSIALNCRYISSRFNQEAHLIKSFKFDDDEWDLRAISPNFDLRDISGSNISFVSLSLIWYKQEVKKYIYHLCKSGQAFGTIRLRLTDLRIFSRYLNQINLFSFHQISRNVILDYLAQEEKIIERRLGTLRDFFTTGTVRGWFNIDPDIIRNDDYPKRHRGNPDPLSDKVREQIEQNLHQLPDPIARMWLICYFAAMRPSELALLKQDCLVQEGEHWKLVWQRKKINDYHEVPISRTIAQVVQEQLEYIKNLWGDEWNYLFCHYHGLSTTNPLQPKLEPLKKVVPANPHNPLSISIHCLVQALDIRNENGQPAKFSPKLLRPTRLTQLFEQGHDLAVVSAWAGHKHFATTSTYYTEVSCELMEREAGHICRALVNSDGQHLAYESLPKSFWETPIAHKLELSGTHINTPIYGFCGLPLDQDCHKFRACYTCGSFVAVLEKLSQYILTRDELRAKESKALANGQDVLVEQFGQQAEQLDLIITGLQGAA